jgi:hypothetical protein
MTASGDGRIWNAGTTVQYYVRATDNFTNASTFPTTAADPQPVYFEFSILPFNNTTSGQANKKLLLVDDYSANTLDFEASSGFNATGGVGLGGFDTPDFRSAEDLYEEVLADLGLAYDKFDVAGAGSSLQSEPTGVSDVSLGLGGYMNDLGNPVYDAVVWFHGNQSQYTLADTTRLELRTFLDRGGKLLVFGDDIALDLGTAGNNSDSTIQFLPDYFGAAFTSINDDATTDRALNLRGSIGTSLANLTFGLYGECPVRLAFDRLVLSTPGVGQTNSILLTYTAVGGYEAASRPSRTSAPVRARFIRRR